MKTIRIARLRPNAILPSRKYPQDAGLDYMRPNWPPAAPLGIRPGDVIGQLLILPIETPQVQEAAVDEIHHQSSSRGAPGGIVEQTQPPHA